MYCTLFLGTLDACTFTKTGKNEHEDYYYRCQTCFPYKKHVCVSCKKTHPADHEVKDIEEFGNCGNCGEKGYGRRCLTCEDAEYNYSICTTCIITCHYHAKHEVEYVGYGSHFCKCVEKEDKSCKSPESKFY